MNETIEIHVHHGGETRLVGHCRYLAKGRSQSSVFSYAASWLTYSKSFALDPANLPLDSIPRHFRSDKSALPGALRDTAPDRWGQLLIKRACRKAGRRHYLSEIDYLLAINDQTRIGALRYRREGDTEFNLDLGRHRVPPLVRLSDLLKAVNAVQGNTATASDLKLLLNEGSPLGGARPKSAIVDKDGTLSIAKFPKPDDGRSIPHGEVLALKLARRAGVNAACGRIETAAERPVALIRRFDRIGEQRIPFLSAMSILGLNDGCTATYTDIAECIRMYSSAPTEDLHELWRRVVFGVMINNLDDHLRNHGFLYDDDGKWRLSPAYDLNPVPVEENTHELATWICEEGPDADLGLAYRAAPYFGLNNDAANRIVGEVTAGLQRWRDLAHRLGMSAADAEVYATAISPET